MKVEDLFEVSYGNGLELNNLNVSSDGINFISRTSKSNGISAKVEKIEGLEPFEEGLITVAVSGNVLESFVQSDKFYTAYHIMVLKPRNNMTINEKIFYCLCLRENKYRYSYGRQANKTLKSINLPNKIPSWVYKLKVNNILLNLNKPFLNNKIPNKILWKEFEASRLFEVSKGKRFTSINRGKNLGNFPYISSTSINNGISGYVNNFTHEGKILTVVCYGEPTITNYYEGRVWVSDSVNVLKPLFSGFNIYKAMFMKIVIEINKPLFNYGRGLTKERLEKLKIKLPIDNKGEPDWNFMENYIKSLNYSSKL
jgi:hypothetical protein